MPALLFQKKEASFATPISDDFILRHMPSANGNYVKVYLYVFHYFYKEHADDFVFSTQEVASALKMLESDVLQALHYWHDQKALTLMVNGEQLWLSFPPFGALPPSGSDPSGSPAEHTKVVRVEHKPTYSPEEISIYEQNPLIKDLFTSASQLLGEQFSFPNLSLLFSFYDYYRLPVDVIKFLLKYCIQGGNRSLRYIERVAQDWADHGINTLEAAQAYVKRFDLYRPIMKALGLTDRKPAQQEIEYMKRWLYQYGNSLEMILEAASRTLRKTGKPSFKYMDSILKSWSENQIHTLEDVAKSDEAFAAKRAAVSTAQMPAASPRQPKGSFHTYIGRDDWDFESIEKRAQQQLYSQEGN